MATISNHHDETFSILKEFNIEDSLAYKIAHFASLYADNPNNPDPINIPVVGVQIAFQPTVAGNNVLHKIVTLTNGSSLSYYCVKPATFYCSSEDRRAVNYSATRNSQNSFDPNETVRHSMLSKKELFEGVQSSISYGLKEDYKEGVNQINSRYGFNIKNRYLLFVDFTNRDKYQSYQIQNANFEFNKKQYLQYVDDINRRIHEMEFIAKNRGIRFGWEKIFLAAQESVKNNFKNWDVDVNDELGVSGLALLGVGIHAIQDAYIHDGENMEHFDEHTTAHIIKDTLIGKKLREITKKIVILFLLMGENYSMLKVEHINSIDLRTLDLTEKQIAAINTKIKEFDLQKFKANIPVSGTTISSVK